MGKEGSQQRGKKVVIFSPDLVCVEGPYREAIESAVEELGDQVTWDWQSPSDSSHSLPLQAQIIVKSRPDVDVVAVPGLEAPYQTSYFTKVLRAGGLNNQAIQMSTLGMAPYDRAYTTAVALCDRFEWKNVALMNSDDYHMRSAQGLRQRLTSAGVHIRRHQIFSTDITPVQEEASRASTSVLAHDLDAIRTSGARVIFLLSSCAATHEVLSTARAKGMLRGYSWIVLHPPSSCRLVTPELPSDLDILETYQGVLGLAWDAPSTKGRGKTAGSSGKRRSSKSGLADFCAQAYHQKVPPSSQAPPIMLADDPLELSPHFLYEALRLLGPSSDIVESGYFLGQDWFDADSLPTASFNIGMSVLSFSGARRVPSSQQTLSLSTNRDGHQCHPTNHTKIEMIYQPIGRLGSSSAPERQHQEGLTAAPPVLELINARPIRWPGDVRTPPKDLVDLSEEVGGGLRHGGGGGLQHRCSTGFIVMIVAIVCIALTPLWNWLFKKLRRTQAQPCLEGTRVSLPSMSEVGDKESREADAKFIASRIAELNEKQMELLRSVEVDMNEVDTKAGIGQGSFSMVYKGYYQNSHVAIKALRKVDDRNFRRFLEEILLHKDLRHPNIVLFRGASWSDGRLLMIVDYAGRGTLADVLRRSAGTLKWKPVKLNMALGIAKGMAFLHQTRYYDMWTSSYQKCIVHRDLKPQNILVTDSYHVQITDFGEARTIDTDNTMTQVGTQLYVAPEVVKGERYNEKCDVYSFAVVLLAMLELKPDVLDVFAEALSEIEKNETGITEERLKEPVDVEVTDSCKTCPLNKTHFHAGGKNAKDSENPPCPLVKHREFKGVVAHAVTRAVVYDDLRPKIKSQYSALKTLIEKCWDPEVQDRPAFSAIVDIIDRAVRHEVTEYTRASIGGGERDRWGASSIEGGSGYGAGKGAHFNPSRAKIKAAAANVMPRARRIEG